MSRSALQRADHDNVIDLAEARLRRRMTAVPGAFPTMPAQANEPLVAWYPVFYVFPVWPGAQGAILGTGVHELGTG